MTLKRFYSILENRERPAYLAAKNYRVNVDLSPDTSTDQLWDVHDRVLQGTCDFEDQESPVSLLDLKIELVQRMLGSCRLCENNCGVNRLEGEVGFCGVSETRVDTFFLHFGEEPEIVPSFTVFFTGCTFKCVYCQNHGISQHPERGDIIPPEKMASLIEINAGSNINWVGGDPGPHLLYILEILRESRTHKPQLWNSNLYQSTPTMRILQGVMDVFLSDFKYGTDACALRLSKVKNYGEVTRRNHLEGQKEVRIGDHAIKPDFIIRHLVLPNHYRCCSEPVIQWLKENMDDPCINVMSQYHPEYKAHECEDISRRISMEEFRKLKRMAKRTTGPEDCSSGK